MDNSNNGNNGNGNGDGTGDRGNAHLEGLVSNHLARLRVAHSPVPLYASPPTFVTAQAAPAETSLLSDRELQFIYRWLDKIALPEDCEPATPEDGAVAPVRVPEEDEEATEEPEADQGPDDDVDPRAQEIRRLLMSFHLHAQQHDLDDVASLVFDPPVPSPRPLALSPNCRLPGAASAPDPVEDEPEHDGTFFFYSGN
ncbi:hypothetical protein C8A05DRAFT_31594 [Staphylotrichum tortipilum]|uniref:Uncharacterized protein n=1 Tax=Staphylotrichum tortipilum TaxID=2831512 RepID=A0AAN6MRE6_9PEZI|nr:hypothetical protein C8A05DRAFT_31594 [Staphylotrichum longicolle]